MEHDSDLLALAIQHSERVKGDLRLLQHSISLKEHFRARDLLQAMLRGEEAWAKRLKDLPQAKLIP